MSEENNYGHGDAGHLPDRVRGDHDLDLSGSRAIGPSRSSDETRHQLAEIKNSIEEIKNPDKRDDMIVAEKMSAIRMSNQLAIMAFLAYCLFTWFEKPFPLPSEFLILIASPYGAWTVERILKHMRSKNGK